MARVPLVCVSLSPLIWALPAPAPEMGGGVGEAAPAPPLPRRAGLACASVRPLVSSRARPSIGEMFKNSQEVVGDDCLSFF
eukprot:6514811-Pyramimonas_sp.AAC.1